ncbi:hypothetical protein SAMN04487995_1766 [Dyadobacter koreensis]|uniref:Uncharacterized protein n=1 Tax=Dyadobacter koreensis TaxID=408657 RepID=A0A1H6SPM0_9BACT|nr:hypothetical protein [Dyadobacter koreensis]SEI69878.1 hypothetical protein SAMN04487995_1766 [Dyadobacter koreensis]
MKHLFKIAVFSSVFFMGCQDNQDVTTVDPETEKSALSEIARLEKESGITFAKKQLTLTDPSGLNKVTLQVASKDASALDEYLNSNELSIEGISQKEYQDMAKHKVQYSQTKENSSVPSESNNASIITEATFVQLTDSFRGYRLNVKHKVSLASGKGARVQANVETKHVSDKFPEYIELTFRSGTSSNASVQIAINLKQQWNTPFNPTDGWHTYGYGGTRPIPYLAFIDGVYKAEVKVIRNTDHDVSVNGIFVPFYSVAFIQN